jgi:hypothetical protein
VFCHSGNQGFGWPARKLPGTLNDQSRYHVDHRTAFSFGEPGWDDSQKPVQNAIKYKNGYEAIS